MSKERRISKSPTKFNEQITTMDNCLQANGAILGVSPGDIAQWTTFRTQWDALYMRYINPLTKKQVDGEIGDVAVFIHNFQQWSMPVLNTIANSPNCTSDLAIVFHIVPVALRANPTRMTSPITEECFASIKVLGGAELEFACRTNHDTKRASKAAHSDSIQVAYSFLNHASDNAIPPVNTLPDINPENGMAKELFSKADFVFHAGEMHAGSRLIAYTRWYNTRHPELSGPWTGPQIVVVA